METASLVLSILMKIAPGLYEYVKALIDGGAEAEKLRDEPIKVSIAFGGGEGHVIEVQRSIEGDMLDPGAE